MLVEVTDRIFESLNASLMKEEYYTCIHRSFMVSADMAHAIHPNYSDKHHSLCAPKIHEGIVLKLNVNQRYATDSIGATILRNVAEKVEVPI